MVVFELRARDVPITPVTPLSRVARLLLLELRKEGAYLLPLRLFIAVGWTRAALEKVTDPRWLDGKALTGFLDTQLAGGHVVFPLYRDLIANVFLPNTFLLGWLVILGQFLVGAAVLTGAFTNLGLLGGLFMNLNFILAGRVNPSAFYVVIQTVLFIANTGSILGADALISKRIPYTLIVAHPEFERRYLAIEKSSFLALTVLSAAIGLAAIPFIRDWSPSSVDDPAMILLVLSTMGGLSALITYFRFRQARA